VFDVGEGEYAAFVAPETAVSLEHVDDVPTYHW
jgi:hypothetical protein